MFRFILIIFIYFFIIYFSYSLKITEVYFDWTNEYIWIYSKDGFSWNVLISWAKKSNVKLNLNINKNREIIIWDYGIQNYFSWFKAVKTWESLLKIADTKAINIDLIYSWWKDNFFVKEDKVKKLNNKKTAFEKFFSWGKEIIQPVKKSVHMKESYVWNPWYVNIFSWWDINTWNSSSYLDCWYYLIKLDNEKGINDCNLFTGNIITCYIKPNFKNENVYSLSFTWNKDFTWITWFVDNNFYKTWESILLNSWNHIKAVWKYKNYYCTWNFYIDRIRQNDGQDNWKLLVNEIHAWNDKFWEYVELKSIWNISWNVLFKWFSRWDTTFSLFIKTYSWQIIVLAKSYSWFIYTWNILKVDKLNLKDNWWNLIIEKSGQVLDNVIYKNKNSRYYSYNSGNVRYFEKNWPSSPWFENFITDYYVKDTTKNYFCNVEFQSFNDWKLNLTSKVSDKKLCDKPYRQIWTYSWQVIIWICNPRPIQIGSWNKRISFQIFSWEKLLCKDMYNFFYNEKIVEKIKTLTGNTYKNLNCSIKIQWKDNYFFDRDLLNFISVVDNKEIQNSNTNYTCMYFLDDEKISDKCNPSSIRISPWLHNLKLSIMSKTWQTCQTIIPLNVPSLSKDDILKSFTISDFQNLITKLKIKYSDSSLKIITEPISYLYSISNQVSKLNSDELQQVVLAIKNKYKSSYTLKKIFNPIKFLYEKNDSSNEIKNCAKLDSENLKQLVEEIKNKYKSNSTLGKIFSPIKFLYETNKDLNKNFSKKIKFIKIVPNYSWNKDIVVLSWNLLTWLFVWTTHKKYKLSKYSLTWENYLFTGNFWIWNKAKCLNIYHSNNIIDSICYILKNDKYILIKPKNDIVFRWNYIIFDNQIIKNEPLINLKDKIKHAIKNIKKIFRKLKRENEKIKKKNQKTYSQLIKRLVQYNMCKIRYKQFTEESNQKYKKRYNEIIKKNEEIRQLKNFQIFLNSFIVYVKKYIPKDIYRQYLDSYKQVKLWKKIRF